MTAVELVCGECGQLSNSEARGWQGHLVASDDHGEDEVICFCPACAAREFGDLRQRPLDPTGQ